MSADLVLRCDGLDAVSTFHPARCRNTWTAEGGRDVREARHAAARYGWTATPTGDLCPRCRATALTATTASAADPVTDAARCFTCGRPEDNHPVRHPFRRLTLGSRITPTALLQADLARAERATR